MFCLGISSIVCSQSDSLYLYYYYPSPTLVDVLVSYPSPMLSVCEDMVVDVCVS